MDDRARRLGERPAEAEEHPHRLGALGRAPHLLVLGTRGYTGVAHILFGTVAGDVLRAVACDVLVVPPTR
jgi:nucleotide-binding universal stress UspA family protein